MKKNIFLYPALFIVGAFLACKKDSPGPPTIITGTVTNKITGEPVAGAYIDCSIKKDDAPAEPKRDHSTYSDSDGIYRLEIPDGFRHSFSSIYQVGYLPYVDPKRSIEIRDGETHFVDAALIPTDGFLRLKIENDLPASDSLFVIFINPTRTVQPYIGGAVFPKKYPYVLMTGGSFQEIFAFPSEEFTTVEWGPQSFSPSINPSNRDSVYLIRNDTVDFTIHF